MGTYSLLAETMLHLPIADSAVVDSVLCVYLTGGGTILPAQTRGPSAGRAGGRAGRSPARALEGDHIDPHGNPANATHFGAVLAGGRGQPSRLQPGTSTGTSVISILLVQLACSCLHARLAYQLSNHSCGHICSWDALSVKLCQQISTAFHVGSPGIICVMLLRDPQCLVIAAPQACMLHS